MLLPVLAPLRFCCAVCSLALAWMVVPSSPSIALVVVSSIPALVVAAAARRPPAPTRATIHAAAVHADQTISSR